MTDSPVSAPAPGGAGGRPSAPAEAVDTASFRHVLGRYATGVTIVTCVQDGFDHAMTANSFTSVSLDPPLVLVCVENDSRFHEAITAVGSWSVSMLAEGQRGRARWFATRGRPLVGQFDATPTRRSPLTGALLLLDALATVECRTVAVHAAGDHDIVVGEVLSLDLARPDAEPLLYYASDFRTLHQGTNPAS